MIPNHPQFLAAIAERKKVRLRFYSLADDGVLDRTCLPLDYGPGPGFPDGLNRYWVLDSQASPDARSLGLVSGPIHAELRVNDDGVWIIEIAGRSIGGLCSQVLRFGIDASLEELIVRQAAGMPLGDTNRRDRAAGVMMIPIPQAGLLREVMGVDEAAAVPLIESVEITARLNYPLVPLPEGDSYLGFIFARGETPAAVELALRQAHERLRFRIDALLPVLSI